jgi:Trk-type K+ transport system membrane component
MNINSNGKSRITAFFMFGGISYGVFCAWKKRRVFIASSSGVRVGIFSRETEPVRYWLIMSIYTSFAGVLLFTTLFLLREILSLLTKG